MSADPSQFEEPILRIRRQIEELSSMEAEPARQAEIAELRQKLTKVSREIYSNLTPWQKTLVARHAQRPYTLDFIGYLFEDFVEVHGDRKFGDDPAIVGGFARFRGQACAVVGHQKGRNTKEKIILPPEFTDDTVYSFDIEFVCCFKGSWNRFSSFFARFK